MIQMQTNPKKRKRISEVLAVAGLTLLTLDSSSTILSLYGYGFLYLTDQQSGASIGIPSIALLFLSLWIGFRQKSRIVTLSLICGGAVLAISKLTKPAFGLNLYLALALPYLYFSLIGLGFTILAIGALRVVKGQ